MLRSSIAKQNETVKRMTRSTKIVLGIGGLFAVGVVAAGSLATYYLVSLGQGTKLANEGYQACLRGDYGSAITKYTAALRRTLPSYQRSYAYLNRGFAYNKKWRFDDAIRDFNAAIGLNPKIPEAYAGRGAAYRHKGELEQAMVDLNQAIELDPNSPTAYFNRGLIFLNKRQWDEAIVDFGEAVRCNPTSADALVNRGICYANKNELDHALASFDGAISINPLSADAFKHRGDLYRKLGQKEKSARDLNEAARLNPPTRRQASTTSRGTALFPPFNPASRGQLPPLSGGMTFDTKIKEFPGVGQTAEDLMLSAELVARAGNVDRTIEFCNQALTKSMKANRTAALVMMRANAYLKKGDLENALHDYGEAATLNPNKVQGYIGRAIVFARKKDYASATNELDAIAPRNPRPLDAALNSVAWIRATYPEANLRDGKKAIEAAERACEL